MQANHAEQRQNTSCVDAGGPFNLNMVDEPYNRVTYIDLVTT